MIGIRLTYWGFAHVYMWIGGLARRVLTCDPKLPSSIFACGKLSILATKRRMRYLQLNVGRQADDGHVRSVIRLITRATRSCTMSRPVRRPVGAPHHTSLQYSNTSLRKLTLIFLRMFDGMWCLYASRFNRFTEPETRLKMGRRVHSTLDQSQERRQNGWWISDEELLLDSPWLGLSEGRYLMRGTVAFERHERRWGF